jgi:hypothetical protein
MRTTERTLKCLLPVCVLGCSVVMAAEPPSLERGRLLYENHCVVCHTAKVHKRIPPLPIDMKELRLIVGYFAKNEKLSWTQQEIEDVAYYLDVTHYGLPR